MLFIFMFPEIQKIKKKKRYFAIGGGCGEDVNLLTCELDLSRSSPPLPLSLECKVTQHCQNQSHVKEVALRKQCVVETIWTICD